MSYIIYLFSTICLLSNTCCFAQAKPAYECIYQITTNNSASQHDKEWTPLIVTVRYEIITDGKWYLVRARSESVNVSFYDMKTKAGEQDSFLINRENMRAYIFEDGQAHPMKMAQLKNCSDTITGKMYTTRQITNDSAVFILGASYPPAITPFPQFTGNSAGVEEVSGKTLKAKLISKKQVVFDFDKYYEKVKHFKVSDEILGLPF